jgi:hypothetical protein
MNKLTGFSGVNFTCDKCGKEFCKECLTYYEELAFCPKCQRK